MINLKCINSTHQSGRTQLQIIRQIFGLLFVASMSLSVHSEPVHLRCENRESPLGIDATLPRFSWQSDDKQRDWRQFAYEILVGSTAHQVLDGNPDVWDSGKQLSSESVGIPYGGPQLESSRRYYWSVRVWDAGWKESSLAKPSWWEMGLLRKTDWKGDWIAWKNPEEAADAKGILWLWVAGRDAFDEVPKTTAAFRMTVQLTGKLEDAALYVAARGSFVAKVNGQVVGTKQNWQEFDREDVTDALVLGKNVIEIEVTTVQPQVFLSPRSSSGRAAPAALAALLKVRNSAGQIQRFPTNSDWEARLEGDPNWKLAHIVANLSDTRISAAPVILPQPAAQFRKSFAIQKVVAAARLYISAAGSYQAFINGSKVGPDLLTPGYTDFGKRIYYQTYDVTSLLRPGLNAMGVLLGSGWYGSPMTGVGWAYLFAPPPERLITQLEIRYTDGTRDIIASDSSWKAARSPILRSTIYAGELFDARLEQNGWDTINFTDASWEPAEKVDAPLGALVAQIDRPPQVILHLTPKTVTKNRGAYIFDMGQNMVGWVMLRVKGAEGTRVHLRFAEILNPDGSIYTKNLRDAEATDTYVLRGGGEEVFAPHFTFHGFRYVELSGFPGVPTLGTITGDVVSSVTAEPTGTLSTSSALVNRMWKVGLWGQRGNFLSIPTDCPQRDERLGWMGDAGVFWRTGAYNFDIEAFSEKWMHDVADAQTKEGAFTNVSPDQFRLNHSLGVPGWSDAGVIVPWTTWLQYGDFRIVRQNWDAMDRYMKFLQATNPGYLAKKDSRTDDWLAPDDRTPRDLLATAYWAMSAEMMSQMAHALGKEDDAARYEELYRNIRAAFQKAYITDDGHVKSDTQTSYVMALHMHLMPDDLWQAAVDHLVAAIASRDWHLSTGFLGTQFLLFALANNGRADVAYRLLLTDTYPSWGYMLSKGATTWWERWNGDTGDPSMNSFNHYALGAVVAWIYRSVAGIDTDAMGPGFHEIVIRPLLDVLITHAHGKYDSVYGTITTDWNGTPKRAVFVKCHNPSVHDSKRLSAGHRG